MAFSLLLLLPLLFLLLSSLLLLFYLLLLSSSILLLFVYDLVTLNSVHKMLGHGTHAMNTDSQAVSCTTDACTGFW